MIGNDEFMAENRGILARFSSARHFFCDKAERKERKERRLLGPRLSMPFDLLPDCFRCGLDWVGWGQ